MPGSILQLIIGSKKQGTGVAEMKNELKDVKVVLGDLGLGLLTAGGAVATLRAAFNETVGVAQQYDQQVVKISTSLRISTEEASRAIQVADDFAISQESLTAAMRIAQQQGVTPNINGLAELSDRYIAITDTAERAAFAQKNLGKNWMEFSRLLEAGGGAIRTQAAGIESGLIVTDEAAKASEKYRVAMDGLSDAMMALKVAIGNSVIPVITGFISAGTEASGMISQQEAILRAHAITAGNAAKETGFLAAAMTPATLSTRIMNGEFDSLDPKLDNIRDGYNAVTAAIMAAGQAGLDAATKFKSTTESMVAGVLASQEYKVGVDDVQLAIAALRDRNVVINVTTITEEITRQTWLWRQDLARAPQTDVNCFVGGTLVDTPAGPVAIADLRDGDLVLSEGGVSARILKTMVDERSDLVTVETAMAKVHCSPNHRWLTRHGWVEAAALVAGVMLVTLSGAPSPVLSVTPYPGTHAVYNLEVSDPSHTYAVHGQVVHNKKGMAAGGDLPLWGEQLVAVGEGGYEYVHIHDGKATVIPHSASRWMAEAGILPGKGFKLEQGGGHIASTGPTGGSATYGQYHVDSYLGSGGASFISNPLTGSTPGTWDWSQGWGGGGGGGGAAAALGASVAAVQQSGASAAMSAITARQTLEALQLGTDTNRQLLVEVRALKEELYVTMRDALEHSR